jgi:hypothetical protein
MKSFSPRPKGPDEEGRLLVRDEAGKLHMVISGDISLAGKWQKKGANRDNHDSSLDFANR